MSHERQRMIEFLETHYGDRFGCYGLGQKGGMIMPDVENKIYNHSKIAISQNNYLRQDYTSDRIWRIMATGTFCLARYFPGIEKIFEKEKHLDWFTNFEEMRMLIDYYLGNDNERMEVAEEGYKLVTTSHTWKSRINELKNTIKIYV
jgi:spore maturation protein CgeB